MAGGTVLIIEILFPPHDARQQPRTSYQEHGPEKSKHDVNRGDLVPKKDGMLMFYEKPRGYTQD
jgi:hypothetical protein